jgi:L-amino acid N-acyltransferase YncA
MPLNLLVRPYRSSDAREIVRVYRDAYNSLRVSRGGLHPDWIVEKVQNKSDEELLMRLKDGYSLAVAEVEETGELVGIGAISNRSIDRIFRSARSKSHYVRESCQRGKAGISVGSMLRRATLDRAKALGFRKVWGYAQPESRKWHKKFGARFYSRHDTYNPEHMARVHYYEIELRPSFWNSIRIEPCLFRIGKLLSSLRPRTLAEKLANRS